MLSDGRVLGGGSWFHGGGGAGAIVDPADGSANLRGGFLGSYQTLTPLIDGTVLEVGGVTGADFVVPTENLALGSANLHDPANNQSTRLGSGAHAGADAAAAVLADGRVLVTGGNTSRRLPAATVGADIFDPATGDWQAAPSMASGRIGHRATTLPNGKVLVTGGVNGAGMLGTAELYDPAANTWTQAGAMQSLRYRHTASRLADGSVLVAGGTDSLCLPPCNSRIYAPATNSWIVYGPAHRGSLRSHRDAATERQGARHRRHRGRAELGP